MSFIHNPPYLIRALFNDFIWTTSNNKILFTFDDGPTHEATLTILNTLDKFGFKALFFCVGHNIEKRTGLAKEILSQGHLIGNHNYSHKNLLKIGKYEQISEIQRCNDVIADKLEIRPAYYRPPYGRFGFSTGKMLSKLNLKNVMWSLLTYDYKNDINLVKFAVNKNLKPNSIVVLHDNIKSMDIIVDSISYIAGIAADRGYAIGEPAECLK